MLLESLSEKHRSRRRSLKTAKGKKGGLIGTAGREAERGQVQTWPSGAALRAPRERREASESIGKQRLIAGGPARSRGCFQRLGALSQLGKHPKSQPEREEFGGFLRHKHTHTHRGGGGGGKDNGWVAMDAERRRGAPLTPCRHAWHRRRLAADAPPRPTDLSKGRPARTYPRTGNRPAPR